ncbi:MAG: flagellar motor switch protein FliG, partial [Thermotogae bacterium]
MPEKKELTGRRKAAILLVILGPDKAAQVLKHLDDETVEQLTIEIANVGSVSDEERRTVLQEFQNIMRAKEMIAKGGLEYAKEVLERAFGPEKAAKIIERLISSLQVRPFDFIKTADPVQIVNFLQNEHPQTVALVLSYLEPDLAAQVLGSLPEDLQVEVLKRIALLERTSPDIVREIERNLEKKLSGFVGQSFSKIGGIDTAAEIMNNVDRTTERSIMEKLAADNPELAEEIRRKMFVFEDILKLDDRSVQLVLREVDTKDLAVALKGASDELKEKIFRNMSKR